MSKEDKLKLILDMYLNLGWELRGLMAFGQVEPSPHDHRFFAEQASVRLAKLLKDYDA